MIGIIGAMDVEVVTLRENMHNTQAVDKAGMTFYQGILEGKDVVLVQCGVGKVNAAMCTQILCDCFHVKAVINTGVAGSLEAKLDIGDLVVSTDVMHHDMNCNKLGYLTGQVPGMDTLAFQADPHLVDYACKAAEAVNPGHTQKGRVASGDQFVSSKEQKEQIVADTGAACTEMEGAAIAHTAYRNQVPFVVIRAISDKADDSAQMDYPSFEAIAAKRCAQVIKHMLKTM